MTLTLRPEVEELLQKELSTGRFRDASDLIETALHVLADSRPLNLIDLNARIQEGLDDIERGDVFTEDEARAYIAVRRTQLDAVIQQGIDSADRGELYSEAEARAYIDAYRAKL